MAMKYSRSLLFGVLLLIGFALTNSKAANTDPPVHCEFLNRNSFEPGFIFGTGSASYQYEGAVKEDGRGPSIWDTYTHKHSEKIADGSNGDVAIDQYHRYKEDVGIMKDMELDAYGGVNKKGIDYYNNLIDELLGNGLKPFVTLFHGDVPQALEDEYGGFLSPCIVDHFKDYVELCYKEFGDRVKHWFTENEPYTFSYMGYAVGTEVPGRCSSWQNLNCTGGDSAIEPYLVAHHLLLAHGAAVELYKNRYQVVSFSIAPICSTKIHIFVLATQKGLIGITLVSDWFEPALDSKQDKDAPAVLFIYNNIIRLISGIVMFCRFLDPLTSGDYPHTMRSIVGKRLPKFTKEQSKLLNGSFDFLGINYYTARYTSSAPKNNSLPASYVTDSRADLTTEFNGVLIGPQAASDWLYVYPKGIHDLVLYTKEKYNDPLIYITENGVSELNNPELSLEEGLHDTSRIDYYYRHLCYLQAAIKNGAKVKGYLAWTLLDNFEWTSGYTVRFGLNYVDYKDGLKRYPKLSAHWFKNLLKKNKFKESYSSL
ncbi:unnamed protein product [Malus baccata var. baccata]